MIFGTSPFAPADFEVLSKGPSIKDVGSLEGGRGVPIDDMGRHDGGRGKKNAISARLADLNFFFVKCQKLPTSFMDGPVGICTGYLFHGVQ